MAEVVFADAAIDDLRRLGPDAAPRALAKVLTLVEGPESGDPLTGFRRLMIDHWRLVYRLTEDGTVEICQIGRLGTRSDAEVYAEAASRVVNDARPDVRRLLDVIDRLVRLNGHVVIPLERPSEPVPDWLAERLVHTAGVAREKVAALNLEQTVDHWAATMCSPHASSQESP